MADALSGMQTRIRESNAIQDAVAAFRASMKANADYHQNLAGLDEGSKYHDNIARIYSSLAR